MVLLFLRPADEDGAVAVEPRVTRLGDPAPRLPIGVAGLEVDLFSTGANVRLEALLGHQRADVGVVVATIKAQPLRLFGGGDRPRDRDGAERVL